MPNLVKAKRSTNSRPLKRVTNRAKGVNRSPAEEEQKLQFGKALNDLAQAKKNNPTHHDENSRVDAAALQGPGQAMFESGVGDTNNGNRPSRDEQGRAPRLLDGNIKDGRVGPRDK